MSDGMGREPAYLSSHATNRYFIPNWGNYFIAKDKFWQVSGYDTEGNTIKGVVVPPFRATITTEGTQAQSLGIVVMDETNSIGQTPTVDNLLSDEAEYFDLQGRRLDGPQKGINLVRMGGKTRKVVIK